MTTELQKIRDAFLRRIDDNASNTSVPVPLSPWNTPFSSAFSFRYSCTEISAQEGGAHVKRTETRFENGRLITEECEGQIDRHAYERAMQQSQQLFVDQMRQAMRLFFLPFGGGRPWDK